MQAATEPYRGRHRAAEPVAPEEEQAEAPEYTCETCGGPVEVSAQHPGLAPEHVNPEDNDHPVVLLQ